tara:strand:+ start:92425 stop:93129 length:705 start_codon:yes stop_codon:yes gene_type:complete
MKKKLVFLVIGILPTSIFSIAGLGISINQSMVKVGQSESKILVDNPLGDPIEAGSFTHHGFENGFGFGGYLYLDIIPVVDLDVEYNLVVNDYKFSFQNAASKIENVSFPYATGNLYVTVQKSVFDLGIPFLASADLYTGLGFNNHVATPMINQEMLTSVVAGGDIENGQMSEEALEKYLEDNMSKASGFHFQAGLKLRLLTFDLITYYRYTFAKDVMPGNNGFGSINFRLGFGI